MSKKPPVTMEAIVAAVFDHYMRTNTKSTVATIASALDVTPARLRHVLRENRNDLNHTAAQSRGASGTEPAYWWPTIATMAARLRGPGDHRWNVHIATGSIVEKAKRPTYAYPKPARDIEVIAGPTVESARAAALAVLDAEGLMLHSNVGWSLTYTWNGVA